ncbi:hypothetical protein H9651_02025 [Microbacterium sp. Sa4CUA7]|uniref:Uncharacterized protein n=1 Tax=Microbacterium pullorum TaxID=2762236 RepID=A0ABR8RYU4_9MICO|nr:hypothetical protein [Microbacterium pullorum]MBD7956410.1 hypothetical protein [Microbacterium pullorum]
MCRAVTCRVCGKTTWTGCGQHVQSVKNTVPVSDWCNGKHSPDQIAAAQAQRSGGGFFSRLFSR